MPSWEDSINSKGGEFQVNLNNVDGDFNFVNSLWEQLALDVVAQRFPSTDQIVGVRILDKSRGGQELVLRLDVWTRFNSEHNDVGREIRDFISKEYIEKHQFNAKIMFKPHAH